MIRRLMRKLVLWALRGDVLELRPEDVLVLHTPPIASEEHQFISMMQKAVGDATKHPRVLLLLHGYSLSTIRHAPSHRDRNADQAQPP